MNTGHLALESESSHCAIIVLSLRNLQVKYWQFPSPSCLITCKQWSFKKTQDFCVTEGDTARQLILLHCLHRDPPFPGTDSGARWGARNRHRLNEAVEKTFSAIKEIRMLSKIWLREN